VSPAARVFRLVVVASVVAGCDLHPGPDSAQRYQQWLKSGHEAQVATYTAYLRDQGLEGIVPIPDLLRSGRRWRRCQAEEFSLPPHAQWSAMTPTLELVAELRAAGVLRGARVASAWRSREFNDCEGGSPRSRHLENSALDFDVIGGADVMVLCRYWRTQGAARRFGLGFYSPTAIHVDTSGFRTWGRDHHRGTSLCERAAPAR
jgi:hypothetical protein